MAKKKHAHHGGAWKVAYADFVTAMMALFMVLWISAQDDEILIATSDFFQNPFNSPMESGYGVMSGEGKGAEDSISAKKSPSTLMDMAFLHTLASELYRMLKVEESSDQKPIEIEVTSDGLRITVYNRGDRRIFEPASTRFTDWGDLIVQNMSWIMDRHDMRVRIDSYTYEDVIPTTDNYSPWELTTDRANIVRRALVHYALNPKKIDRVTGFGPSKPMAGRDLKDPENDRIEFSLVVN
jgi:chemotaxis protein MotB